MRKNNKILTLIFSALFLFGLTFSAIAKEIHFFEVQNEFLNKINMLRANPTDIAEELGLDLSKINDKWKDKEIRENLSTLELNEDLTKMAEEHIKEMVENGYIGHESEVGDTLEQRAEYFGYNGIFNGESIFVFCFENFVPFKKAKEILWSEIVKDALYGISAEGAPLVFPFYRDLGVALGAGQITLDETTYNAYILCIEFGVPESVSGYILGRIYEHTPLPEYGVSNVEIKGIQYSFYYSSHMGNIFLDGSFFIPWDGISPMWLEIYEDPWLYPKKTALVLTPTVYIEISQEDD